MKLYTIPIILILQQMVDRNNANVRQLMIEYFETPSIQATLLNYIQQHNLNIDDLNDRQLMAMMEDLNLLNPLEEEVLTDKRHVTSLDMFQIAQNLKPLKIIIKRGRLFTRLFELGSQAKFFISVNGFYQRARTNTYSVSQSFNIEQPLVLRVNPNLLVVENSNQLQLALVVQYKNGSKQIYAIKSIEWRHILCSGVMEFDIEMAPYKHQQQNPIPCIGILTIKLQITPFSQINKISQRLLVHQFQLQQKNKEINNKKFYENASKFWNDYKMIHYSLQTRRIKVYSQSEDKINVPTCRLVSPLYNVRGIDSPHHALRFCSLIAYQDEDLQIKGIHKRFHSMLISSLGSVDDHSNLLCSLLLGFGLKAYVCIGISARGDHSWVLTIEKDTFTFWQCTKGVRHDFYSPLTHQFYFKVHCVYNHQQFYANAQLDDSVASTDFKFKDSTKWKTLDSKLIEPLLSYNSPLTLLPPTFDLYQIQEDLSFRISKQISQYRKFNKLSFNYDEVLASILSIALANYEMQRTTGLTFGTEQFQTAIKNYIPLKHTFKAFPIELKTLDPVQIIQTLKNQSKCRQILLAKGDQLFFAVKVKLILFPQNIFAVWMSIAVRYYKIN